jgi:hypothetical protein
VCQQKEPSPPRSAATPTQLSSMSPRPHRPQDHQRERPAPSDQRHQRERPRRLINVTVALSNPPPPQRPNAPQCAQHPTPRPAQGQVMYTTGTRAAPRRHRGTQTSDRQVPRRSCSRSLHNPTCPTPTALNSGTRLYYSIYESYFHHHTP